MLLLHTFIVIISVFENVTYCEWSKSLILTGWRKKKDPTSWSWHTFRLIFVGFLSNKPVLSAIFSTISMKSLEVSNRDAIPVISTWRGRLTSPEVKYSPQDNHLRFPLGKSRYSEVVTGWLFGDQGGNPANSSTIAPRRGPHRSR